MVTAWEVLASMTGDINWHRRAEEACLVSGIHAMTQYFLSQGSGPVGVQVQADRPTSVWAAAIH